MERITSLAAVEAAELEVELNKLPVSWRDISTCNPLSAEFISEHHDKVDIDLQRKTHHDNRTMAEKLKEMEAYALDYNLDFKDGVLIAYREHDKFGRGSWNNTIHYGELGYYNDWRCDLDLEEENSFGLVIWPKGNVKVSVSVDDWGTAVDGDGGKARVYGFTLLEIGN